MNCFLDIETIGAQPEEFTKIQIAQTIKPPAQIKKAETIQDWHNGVGKYAGVKDAAIENEYRKGALDGGIGEVISVCFSINGEMHSTHRTLDGDYTEGQMLIELFALIDFCSNESSKVPPYFIGHNIKFDLKFLWRRAKVLNIDLPFKLPFRGRHRTDFFDNSAEWCEYNEYISQDKLARCLGIAGKPDDIDGSKVWDYVKAGNVERVAEYNQYDVETVIKIYERLTA